MYEDQFPYLHQYRVFYSQLDIILKNNLTIQQDNEEIGLLIGFLESLNYRLCEGGPSLEIGVRHGGFSFIMARLFHLRPMMVDIKNYVIKFHELFDNHNIRFTFIHGDSTKKETVDEVKTRLGGEPIELLMIDGYHTYEAAKSDFDNYSPLVKPGGIILFHDILDPGPKKAFNEARMNHLSLEIVSARTNHRHHIQGLGFGILFYQLGTVREEGMRVGGGF